MGSMLKDGGGGSSLELVCDPARVGNLPGSAVANGSVTALAAGLCCWDGCVAGSLSPPTEGWGLAWLPRFPCAMGASSAALPRTVSFGSWPPCPGPSLLWTFSWSCAAPAAPSLLLLHFQLDLFLLLCSSAVFIAIKPTPGFFCTRSLMQ